MPPPDPSRRAFLVGSGAVLAGLLVKLGQPRPARASAGIYGPLVPDPAMILDLPAGFSYRVLDRFGDKMDDGYVVPALPDGMAAFPGPNGTVVLMRNHELLLGDGPYDIGAAPPEAFDPVMMGCVTRVVLDGADFTRISSNLVLCGTLVNCAGGPTPWGWLSCEENVSAGHGYVFLCDATATGVRPPQKIAAYGRFKHEAACIDTATNIVYLTEDQTDSAFYRFVPADPREPFVGRLQALKITDHDVYDASAMAKGARMAIEWVDIDDPDPPGDTVRAEARSKGAAVFDRGEGITFFKGEVFMIATAGGPAGKGQIFRIIDRPGEATIEAILVADDPEVVDRPDNVTVAPWGEIFFGEDGSDGNHIRGITKDGQVFDFARNVASLSELSGVCFSPDGRALFVNSQRDNTTFVITGPFPPVPDEGETGGESTGGESTGGSTGEPTTGSASTGVPESKPAIPAPTGDDMSDQFGDDDGCGCKSGPDASGAAVAVVLALGATARGRRPAGE